MSITNATGKTEHPADGAEFFSNTQGYKCCISEPQGYNYPPALDLSIWCGEMIDSAKGGTGNTVVVVFKRLNG